MSQKSEAKRVDQDRINQARTMVRESVANLRQPPEKGFKGQGIVVCAGGYKYFTNAWILIKMLRHLGCNLPIQVWHRGATEIDARMSRIMAGLDVECIDATPFGIQSASPGQILKVLAIAGSSFEEVLYLDADNLAVRDPAFLFTLPQYQQAGALFWPGIGITAEADPLWKVFGLPYIDAPDVESGQIVINKRVCWEPLALTEQLNLRSEVFYRFAKGGNELFRFAWRKLGKDCAMPEFPPQLLTIPDQYGEVRDAVLCQHDFSGERIFQHRCFCKWDLIGENPWVSGFFYESKCREFLEELRTRWNGRCGVKRRPLDSENLRACKQSLVGNIWLVEVPVTLSKKTNEKENRDGDNDLKSSLPDFVKLPQDVGQINVEGKHYDNSLARWRKMLSKMRLLKELRFASDGTIKMGATEQIGSFWELTEHSPKPQLLLSSGGGAVVRLKQVAEHTWKGRWISGPLAGECTKLHMMRNVYSHLTNPAKGKSKQAVQGAIVRAVGKRVHLTCSAEDIGDHIVAAHACAGLSHLGVQVTFHTPHAVWLSRIAEPGLVITEKEHKTSHDLNSDWTFQLRFGASRASWFAARVHPMLGPAKPVVNLNGTTRRFPFDKYIIMAPFAKSKVRNWPEIHWTRLANLLRGEGYELVAIGFEDQAPSLLRTFSQTQAYWVVNHQPEWIMDALLGAATYIGTDNDITHLAALLQVKSVVIHSQLPASFLWPQCSIQSVLPDTKCTLCRFQPERGYLQPCEVGCSALASVSPEAVLSAVLKSLGK